EGREVVEEQRKAHRRAIQTRECHFRIRTGAEQRREEVRFGRDYLILEMLVHGELADECQHLRQVARGRRTDGDGARRAAHPVLCSPWAMPATLASSASNRSRSVRPPARQRCSRSTCIRLMGSREGLRSWIERCRVGSESSSAPLPLTARICSHALSNSLRISPEKRR